MIFNNIKISKFNKEIFDKGAGYRSEDYQGSKIRKLEDVVKFEMDELSNEDIPDYVLSLYHSYCKNDRDYNHNLYSLNSDEVLNIIEKLSGVSANKLYAIWLATFNRTINMYGSNIDKYYIDNSYLFPISDLGNDGILMVTDTMPGGEYIGTINNNMTGSDYIL